MRGRRRQTERGAETATIEEGGRPTREGVGGEGVEADERDKDRERERERERVIERENQRESEIEGEWRGWGERPTRGGKLNVSHPSRLPREGAIEREGESASTRTFQDL